MKRLLTGLAVLTMAGLLSAQQTPSTQPDSQSPATQTDTAAQMDTHSQPSTKNFEGTITKSGDKLVLQDTATQASYQLDNQGKAKKYEGQKVKVVATMDSTTNTLHVVDIAPSDKN